MLEEAMDRGGEEQATKQEEIASLGKQSGRRRRWLVGEEAASSGAGALAAPCCWMRGGERMREALAG